MTKKQLEEIVAKRKAQDRREHIAALAMSGWLAAKDAMTYNLADVKHDAIARGAVAMADALIAELDRTRP